ncbi:MAG: anti-sigma factor antagonist [Thermodesulfobacteriota bacterium]
MKLKTEMREGVMIITLEGERLDAPQAEGFLTAMQNFVKAGNVNILLDMSSITFMDSTGLGSIIRSLKEVYSRGQLVFCGVSEQVTSLLKLTHLDNVFTIAPGCEEALGRFMAPPAGEEDKDKAAKEAPPAEENLFSQLRMEREDESDQTDHERRRYRRVTSKNILDKEIIAGCRSISTGKKSSGIVTNLSAGGLCMLSNTRYQVDDELLVKFNIGAHFKLSERVIVRRADLGKYGVEFIDISESARTFLSQLVGASQLTA